MTKEGEVVTNVLSVKNQNGIAREFYIEIGCPTDWRVLTSSKKVFNVEPNDSIFIPIRLLPNIQTMKGSTKYNISVFVVGPDGQTYAVCSFQVGKPRRVDWEMHVLPRTRIYFLNDQYDASLGINVSNNGEEAQEVNLSWRVIGQGLNLKTENNKSKGFLDLLLDPEKDTTINFYADLSLPLRNFRRPDIDNYRPSSMTDARKYTLLFKAVEPKNNQNRAGRSASAELVKLNSSVDFIKLSSYYSFSDYAQSAIPVTYQGNIYNILGIQPVMANSLMINAQVGPNQRVFGNLQHMFSYYSPSSQTFQSLSGSVGYTSPQLILQFGQGVGLRGPNIYSMGGNSTGGTGLSAAYTFKNRITLSSFAALKPNLFSVNGNSLGVGLGYANKLNTISLSAGAVRSNIFDQQASYSSYFSSIRWRFLKKHSLTLRFAQLVYSSPIFSDSRPNATIAYVGSFFKNRFQQRITAGITSNVANSTNAGINNTRFINSNSQLELINNWKINLNVGYYNRSFQSSLLNNTAITVPLTLKIIPGPKFFIKTLPAFLYVYTEDLVSRNHFRGLNYMYSYNNFEKNIRASVFIQGGYNRYTDTIKTYKELFSANAFLNCSYRTFSFNVRYMYGPSGVAAVRNFHLNGQRYPQMIASSFNYQYVFKNTHFIGDLALNHTWNNQSFSHSIYLAPQLYFFTRKNLRLNIQFMYNLNSRNNERAVELYQDQGFTQIPDAEEKITLNNNFSISLGVKKTFGIPIPKKFRKVDFVNAHFVAFLDFNGNKIMDKEEVPLENIVIKVNGHEVLTDKDGKAKFVNIPVGTYEHKIIPLVDLDGWFTYSMDSIDIIGEQYYVPFTKGVKVAGSVVLDREKFTKDVLATLDLSGIKIFTTDTSGNTMATMTDFKGNFSFYVPYGSYILSMDEEVIGDRFYIAQNHIPMDLYDGMDGFYQSFFIIEKRRNVKKKKFNEKGELIMVDEVEGGLDRNENNSTTIKEGDSTVIHNNNQYNIFNDNRKSGGDKVDPNAGEWYKELDERINRLDELIRLILDAKGLQKADNKVLQESLRRLKEEDASKKDKGFAPQPIMETMDPNKHYHLVVGGFVYRENADRFVQQMKAKGFDKAVVIGVFNGHYLVRILDFETREEAIAAQNQYAYVVEGIWVHTWP
jgi:hypothetical protein